MGGVLIYSFAAATLGGFDSPLGAVLGGWIIGVAENLAGTYVDFIGSDLKILVPLVAILVVLLFRPTGLFGSAGGGAGMSAQRMRLARWGAGARPRRAPAVLLQRLPRRPVHAGAGARRSRCSGSTCSSATAARSRSATARSSRSAPTRARSRSTTSASRTCSRCRSPALVCALAGFLLGLPALRLRGLYLALVTLGLAIATPQIIKRADGLTGGTQGLSIDKITAPAWSGLADDQWLYFVTLVVTAVMFVLAAFLVRGRVGRALVAIRDNEIAARTMGVDLARYKTGTFAVSAAYAGVGGALFTLPIGFLAPESFPLALSFAFLAAIVVGGLATIAGALFGALFIEFVPVYAADVDEALAGRHLRRRADPLHVPASGRRDGARAPDHVNQGKTEGV